MNTPAMPPPTAVVETLERLSSKAGVVATLAIDRLSSTVLASTGNFQTMNVPSASSTAASSTPPTVLGPVTNNLRASVHESSVPSASAGSSSTTSAISAAKPSDQTFDFASRIWQYVNFSGSLVQDMDSEDDLKLLRLRTKKHEFMIVPDPKYIFVVVHEVSS